MSANDWLKLRIQKETDPVILENLRRYSQDLASEYIDLVNMAAVKIERLQDNEHESIREAAMRLGVDR